MLPRAAPPPGPRSSTGTLRAVAQSAQTFTLDARRLVAAWAADCAEHVLAIFEAEAPADTDAGRRGAVALAVELRDFLFEPLALEDADVLPMIERHFAEAECGEIDERIMKQMSPRQALFTARWFMSTLEPETAAVTLRVAPLPLTVVYFLGRRRYARLARTAFGDTAIGPSRAANA